MIEELLAIWQRVENAPDSPVLAFLPLEVRREARRAAVRLRKGQLVPNYPNVVDANTLATIYQNAALRDAIFEREGAAMLRTNGELKRLAAEDELPVVRTFNAMFLEAQEAAKREGPESEAWDRYRRFCFLIDVGEKAEADKRRNRVAPFGYILPYLKDPRTQALWEATAAEILTEAPAGETVFAFPADDSGRGRVVMRIGVRNAAWIGSFARGNKGASTVQPMPGNKQLFVSAAGAGYIIDACSRTLVETIGDDVVSVGRDESGEIFIVNHDDRSFEAFGSEGRLWKTEPIGSGGFRNLTLGENAFAGEARQSSEPEWVAFSVDLATGQVSGGGGR